MLRHISRASQTNMVGFIRRHVPNNSTTYSEEAPVYKELKRSYTHDSITHALSIYVEGGIHTNTIMNFWSVLKRGIYGVCHQFSEKHLERYLDEYSAKFNTRKLSSNERFVNFFHQSESVLTYNELTRN